MLPLMPQLWELAFPRLVRLEQQTLEPEEFLVALQSFELATHWKESSCLLEMMNAAQEWHELWLQKERSSRR